MFRDQTYRIAALVVASVVAATLVTPALAAGGGTTTFLIVRHAEKATGDNPSLTTAGTARARELARVAADLGLAAVYATPYNRTQQTARPAAEASGVEVRTDAIETADIAGYYAKLTRKLLESHAGGRILLVGHSNTVPVIVEALGVEDAPRLSEKDYDDLFVVSVSSSGKAELLHLHYGAVSP